MTEFTTPDKYFAGIAYKCKSKRTLMDYQHASCWTLTKSGWGKSTTKNSSLLVQAYHLTWCTDIYPKKQSTILGHLQKPRKGLRSTQEKLLQSEPDPEQDKFPPSTQSEDTNLVFLKTVDITGKKYTDQTGRFLVTSSKGKKCILVS